MNLPEGWQIVNLLLPWSEFVKTPIFGKCDYGKKTIFLYHYPGIPEFVYSHFVYPHELLHAHGHKGCKHFWCFMYEGGDNWFEKLALPAQLLYGARLCADCRKEGWTLGV